MAWERVHLRRSDGAQTGPHPIAHVLAWNEARQIPPDCTLIDAATGETCALAEFARLPSLPSSSLPADSSGNAMNKAVLSCALGVIGIPLSFCCCALGMAAGVSAIGLGSMAIHESAMGNSHTAKTLGIVGVVLGAITLIAPVGMALLSALMR
ncbi:hypothetical protein GC173_08735 [bacterium]|nr:hypothetical protein [bacterium]